jgi:hypothetical protein
MERDHNDVAVQGTASSRRGRWLSAGRSISNSDPRIGPIFATGDGL